MANYSAKIVTPRNKPRENYPSTMQFPLILCITLASLTLLFLFYDLHL